MNRSLTRILLPLRQHALFSQARGCHDAACRKPTHCLPLTLVIAAVVTLCSEAQATSRSPMSMFELDRALQTSRVVIRGKVIGGHSVGFRPTELFPGSSPLTPGQAYFPAISVKVEKVLSGWYWGDVIEVVLMDQNDRLQCKMDDEVVVCANFRKGTRCFVMPSAGFFVKGEKGKWWIRSSYAMHPIGYTTRQIKDLTRQRNVMK
jgi:hypothetical protein